ncbi:hypothetical protein J8I26_02855 [Herbaspirillum sp. LeCh32-8]|uniref:T6SS immunity protein Tli3 family protein n=1 Tax=Herbaspirillum sp. LeCh32-8 TaxID=2821356 RepID=UPI001AE5C8E0|nr:hypothetical protein [Herbaspirillum sp. LeCh32-8]MBP0597025.1 hypothetical protein [Herbaspirillum sp. LeCh32-8]
MMNTVRTVGMSLLVITLSACASDPLNQQRKPVPPPMYDVAPQVIYRIDDHRYISLENYDRCRGQNFYIDTQAGIRTEIMTGNLSQYRGKLVIDDPTGMNIVIPEAPGGVCGDKGCNAYLGYSTDGGRTFKYKKYMQAESPAKDSQNYSILVGQDGVYVAEKRSQTNGATYVTKYPLVPGIDLDKPYPPGVQGEGFPTSKKPLPLLRTPSGQDHITCDAAIRPSNLPLPK